MNICSTESPGAVARRTPHFSADADVLETDRGVRITLDFPGVPRESLEVLVEESTLTVRGSRPAERSNDGRLLLEEVHTGALERSFRLGRELDLDRIEAHHELGTLQLWIPRREAAQPRAIPIADGGVAIEAPAEDEGQSDSD